MMKVAFSSSQGMRGTYGKNGKPGDAVSSNYLAKPGITLLETFLSNDNSAVIFCAFFFRDFVDYLVKLVPLGHRYVNQKQKCVITCHLKY